MPRPARTPISLAGRHTQAIPESRPARAAQNTRIWTAFVPIVIDLASAPNGGSARSYQPGFA
jgi:hypothetical protein